MSKGVPIAQRPDLKDASLSTRLDAVFGALGPAPGAGGWSLRQDFQPFRAGGGIEDYNYSSDEEDPNEGLKPLMPSRLVDSDDDEDDDGKTAARDRVPPLERADPNGDAEDTGFGREQNEARAARERERMRATLSSRRAFEAEAEEDEFDRVATGTMDPRNRLMDARPPGFTEVPLDSAWERMHGRLQEQQQRQCDITIPIDGPSGGAEAAAAVASTASVDSSTVLAGDGYGDGDKAGSAVMATRKRSRRGAAEATAPPPADHHHGHAHHHDHRPQQQREQQPQLRPRPLGGDVPGGDVEMLPTAAEDGGADHDGPGDAPLVRGCGFEGAMCDTIGALGMTPSSIGSGDAAMAVGAASPAAAPAPRLRGGRRVQWADFVAASSGRRSDAVSAPHDVEGREADAVGRSNGPTVQAMINGSGGDGGDGRDRGNCGGGRVRLDWQRRGFVPDHVRNPHKYTMYTLDEELVVGGGDRSANGRNGRNGGVSSGDGGGGGGSGRWGSGGAREGADGELQQAVAQARQAVEASTTRPEHDPERVETTFGSGIAFRPRAARQQQQQAEQTARRQSGEVGNGAPAGAGADLGFTGRRGAAFAAGGDEGEGQPGDGGGLIDAAPVQTGAGQGGGGGALRGGGRRHFRGRLRREDGGEDDGGGGGAVDGGDGGGTVSAPTTTVPDGDAMQQD